MQVDQCGIFGSAAAGLVQALAVQTERRAGRCKQLGRFKQRSLGDAAGLRHQLGRVVAHGGFKVVKAVGVRCDVGCVNPPLPQHDVQHAVEEHHVGAGLQRQVQIGNASGISLARVAEDDLERWIRLLRVFDPAKQNRMRVGRVGADDEDALGMVHIVVAGGRRIRAQRLLVARYRAAHAQA